MSRAFVKEDVDVPERSTRRRSASGLPPGAVNYMTAAGALELRGQLAELQKAGADEEEIAELESLLQEATVVQPPVRPQSVLFGSTVTLQNEKGGLRSCRIVGVDEVPLDPRSVSWVSPTGKALLGASVGQRVKLQADASAKWTVIKIE